VAFNYRKTFTPVITSFDTTGIPHKHRLVDGNIVIKGSGFATSTITSNTVSFGGFTTTVVAATASTLTVKLNAAEEPPINSWLAVKVSVFGKGDAAVEIASPSNYSIILQQTVTALSPTTGSFAGGTILTIGGYGLNIPSLIVSFSMEHLCMLVERTYTRVTCRTPSKSPVANQNQPNETFTVNIYDGSYASELQQKVSDHTFTYSMTATAMVTFMRPNIFNQSNTELTVKGTGFGADASKLVLTIGSVKVTGGAIADDGSGLKIWTVNVPCLPPGHFKAQLYLDNQGDAEMDDNNIHSQTKTYSATPASGSIYGGTAITINGYGYYEGDMSVTFHELSPHCKIVSSTSCAVTCITPSPGIEKAQWINLLRASGGYVDGIFWNYKDDKTPIITSISAASGKTSDSLVLTGTFQGAGPSDYTVDIGGVNCVVTAATPTAVTCTLGEHSAGTFNISLHASGFGNANPDTEFLYSLGVDPISQISSGYGGGKEISLAGHGFGNDTTIEVCGNLCKITGEITYSAIKCIAPVNNGYIANTPQTDCDVLVKQGGVEEQLSGAYRYLLSQTSQVTNVSPRRAGTGGGVTLTITGTGFTTNQADLAVTIDDVACVVVTATAVEITCTTGAASRTAMNVNVMVEITNQGKSVPVDALVDIVDVWSSPYSWGGNDPPKAGKTTTCFFYKKPFHKTHIRKLD